ncbi:MAG: amidohydrolase family protein [Chloroflexi bacterium]|nr:amidohydrolase family protein [Chloroflexota bacterium]
MLLKATRLLDGTGGAAVHQAAVRVEGERISAVGIVDDFDTRAEETTDLGEATLLPGLIDMHGHLRLSHLEPEPQQQIKDDPSRYIDKSAENLRASLLGGVTTMRCNGDRDFIDLDLRQRVADGDMYGPRLLVATRGIKAPDCTGGMVATVLVDGEDRIRAAIHENAGRGADHIKIFSSGGLGPRETATAAFWTASELRAAVDAAHSDNLPIVAHCHGGPSAMPLIEAGVDTIEHGSYLTSAELEEMTRRGTRLDMTLGILLSDRSVAHQHLKESLGQDEFARMVEENLDTMRTAVALGVRITLGTDTMHGMLWFEAATLASLGVPNAKVIATLTSRAAEALNRSDQFGTLESGRIADIIAIDGNPLEDIGSLERPVLVMSRGRIMHRSATE